MWFLPLLALLFAFAQTDQPPTAGWLQRTLEHDGMTRTYSVYVPVALLDPVPLVIALHPSGTSGAGMALISRFNELADVSGVIVAYPDGPGGYWDYGAGLPQWEDVPDLRDDPGFVAAMIEEIDAEWTLDRTRLFAVGYSNGARMAHRLACELPLAAAAMVAATIGDEIVEACSDDVVSVWMQHGTADPVVPFAGDADLMLDDLRIGRTLSVNETAQFYARRNGCDNPTLTALFEPTELAALAETNQVSVALIQYQACADGSAVEVAVADGGGHGWRQVNAVDTSALIWAFFASHVQSDGATDPELDPADE